MVDGNTDGALPNTASRLIAMAASLTGDAEAVRTCMQCTEADFQEYCTGAKEPTWPEFDRLTTLIDRELTAARGAPEK